MLKIWTKHTFLKVLPDDNSIKVNAETEMCIFFGLLLELNKHIKQARDATEKVFQGFRCFYVD